MASKINIGASIGISGEKEYRQAIKNITSEQKLLTSEMKLASSQYSDNANSLEALNSKNVILTKQIDNQTDKVKVYAKAVEESTEKQVKSAEQVEKYKNELDKANKEMEDMKKSSDTSTESIEKQQNSINELTKKLTLSENAYEKSIQKTNSYQTSLNTAESGLNKLNDELLQNEKYLKEASNSTDKTATSIDNMGRQISQTENKTLAFVDVLKANLTGAAIIGGVQALATAFSNTATGIVDLGAAAAKYADDMLTMSVQTGISTDKLQAYNYMAELTDTSMETIEKTMVKNIRSMTSAQQGTATYVDAYKQLGVAVTDGNGKLLDSETVYWQLIDALGKVGDETERDSLSLTIFGKSAQDLNTLIAQGSQGVSEFTDEAKKMGAILDSDTLQKLGATDDAIQRFTQSTEILKRKIGAELSDELTESMDRITNAISDSDEKITDLAEGGVELLTDGLTWFIDNSDVIIAGLVGIGGAVIAMKAVDGIVLAVEAYKSLSTALKGTAVAQELLNVAQMSNPIGLVVGLVAGLTAALLTYNAVATTTTSETDKFIESTRNVNTSLAESITKRNESVTSLNSEIGFMQKLSAELTTLNEKEKLTTTEKSRMNEIVRQLNSSMPELNLQIDEQTGKVKGNTKAIQESIDKNLEWYKIQAAKEELIALMEEQGEAELEIYKIDQEIAKQTEELNNLQNDRTKAIEDSTKALESGVETNGDYQVQIEQIAIKEDELTGIISKLNSERKDLTSTQEEQAEQTDLLNGFIGENTEVTEENAEATDQLAQSMTVYGQVVEGASTEVADSLAKMNEGYTNAKQSAMDSMESQIGLFQAAEEQSSISVSAMASNLATQTEAFNQYKDDLLIASDLVAKGLMDDGLLGYIESFGLQGSASLHELVTAAETDKESFNALMSEWTEMNDAKEQVASSMAEIETSYKDGLESIGIIIDDGNEETTQSTVDLADGIGRTNKFIKKDMVDTFDSMLTDVNNTIIAKTPEVATSTTTMATTTITALNTELNVVDGKSLKAQTAGVAITDGLVTGINSGTSKVASAFQNMVNNAISKADFSGFASKIDKMLGDALR